LNWAADREAFKKKVEENFSYPRVGLPALKNNGRFYLHYNSGLDPQTTIYEATREEIDAIESSSSSASSTAAAGATKKPPGKPWFDANLLSKDGTVALSYTRFSHSGKYVCYGISASGSDWHTLYFRGSEKPFVASQSEAEKEKQYSAAGGPERLPDTLEDVKFCVPYWTHDDKGVFYKRFPKPTISTSKEDFSKGTETDANVDSQVWYHRLGTRQEEDILVISKDPENPSVEYDIVTSDDGKYLMAHAFKDTDPKNKIVIAKLEGQEIGRDMKWVSVAGDFQYSLDYITNDGDKFYWSESA
jgi:prolyl oligopeptidase